MSFTVLGKATIVNVETKESSWCVCGAAGVWAGITTCQQARRPVHTRLRATQLPHLNIRHAVTQTLVNAQRHRPSSDNVRERERETAQVRQNRWDDTLPLCIWASAAHRSVARCDATKQTLKQRGRPAQPHLYLHLFLTWTTQQSPHYLDFNTRDPGNRCTSEKQETPDSTNQKNFIQSRVFELR